jgi:hypothetical protein
MFTLGFAIFTVFSLLLSVTWMTGPPGRDLDDRDAHRPGRYPVDRAAPIALEVSHSAALASSSVRTVRHVLFTGRDHAAWMAAAGDLGLPVVVSG